MQPLCGFPEIEALEVERYKAGSSGSYGRSWDSLGSAPFVTGEPVLSLAHD